VIRTSPQKRAERPPSGGLRGDPNGRQIMLRPFRLSNKRQPLAADRLNLAACTELNRASAGYSS
jgi:hypothetical protein